MFKVTSLTIEKNQRHLFSDVSFILEDTGLCSLWTKDDDAQQALSYVLAGLKEPTNGTIHAFGATYPNEKDEDNQDYRRSVVTHWFEDFLFIAQATAKENILIEDSFSPSDFEKIINLWQIEDLLDQAIEDLTFKEQVQVYLARVMIRDYKVLIFYPNSTPYSKEELQIIYPLLKQCSKYMLVVVVGDQQCYSYADRKIEFYRGEIVSDDRFITDEHLDTVVLQPTVRKPFLKQGFSIMRKRYNWIYNFHFIFLLLTIYCLTSSAVVSSFNIVNIEHALLKQNDLDFYEVQKTAIGNDGKLYDMYHENLTEEDINDLEEQVDEHFLPYYKPIDVDFANAYLEGVYREEEYPIYNKYPVLEVDDLEHISNYTLVGRFPDTDAEVMLPTKLVNEFFGDISAKEAIGKQISWYGIKMKVVGVYDEEQEAYKIPALYVTPDFVSRHHLAKMKSVPPSEKRIIYGDTLTDIEGIQPSKTISRYFDGRLIQLNKPLHPDEVVLNASIAKELGFPADELIADKTLTYQQKLSQYLQFTKQWIGKEIEVQMYTIHDDPLNSIMQQYKVKVIGFLLPSMDVLEGIDSMPKSILYLSEDLLEPILTKNIQVDTVYYQNEDDHALKQSLKWMQQSDLYDAAFDHSILFQLLIIDLKELTSFFFWIGVFFFVVSFILYGLLLMKTIERLRVINSVYYAYGHTKQEIFIAYKERFTKQWLKQALIAVGIVLIFMLLYVHLIRIYVSVSISIFHYLFVLISPLIITLILVFILCIGYSSYLKKQALFIDAYQQEL